MDRTNTDKSALQPEEKQALIEYETILENYQHSPFKAGQALQRIRDDRLYRELFPDFDGYSLEKWGFSRSTADRLILAWTRYELLAPIGVKLENESQARALLGLTDEQTIAAGKLALRIAGGKKLTARHFLMAAEQVRPPSKSGPVTPKATNASSKSVALVLTLVSQAEAAVKEDNYDAVLEALTAIKACLAPPTMAPAAEQDAGSRRLEKVPGAEAGPAAVPEFAAGEPVPLDPEAVNGKPSPITFQSEGNSDGALGGVSVKPDTALSEASGSKPSGSTQHAIRPAHVRLGTTEKTITRWNEVLIFVANWLLGEGHPLPDIACIKRNPLDFPASAHIKKLAESWYVDIGDGQKKLLRNARLLLEKSGHGDVSITLTLTNGDTLTV